MTEFYVSRHIHSKFHFTKKFCQTEHLQNKLSLVKRAKKKQYVSNCKQKKATLAIPSAYEHYKIQGATIQKYSNVEDLQLIGAESRSLPDTGGHEMQTQSASQTLATGQVLPDYLSAGERCKTPENLNEFVFEGDTLKKCSHSHSNVLLEGCSDIETSPSCSLDKREQVKQRLYECDHPEDANEEINEIPQNLLNALGFDYDWGMENEWTGNATQVSPIVENAGIPQEMFSVQQNQFQMSTEFPIEVVNGRSAMNYWQV